MKTLVAPNTLEQMKRVFCSPNNEAAFVFELINVALCANGLGTGAGGRPAPH